MDKALDVLANALHVTAKAEGEAEDRYIEVNSDQIAGDAIAAMTPVARIALAAGLLAGQPVTDAMAAAAHDAWLEEKLRRLRDAGLPESWLSETGEEQLVPWAALSEPVRDFDRIVIAAALRAALSRDG